VTYRPHLKVSPATAGKQKTCHERKSQGLVPKPCTMEDVLNSSVTSIRCSAQVY
jgi:hypothetical protein